MSRRIVSPRATVAAVLALAGGPVLPATAAAPDAPREKAFRQAVENGARVEEVFRRTRRMLHAWLAYADQRTLLLPDVLPGYQRGPKGLHIYRPHNSGADNYLYDGGGREMVRLGSELEDGVEVQGSSRWVLEPFRPVGNPGESRVEGTSGSEPRHSRPVC